MKFKVGDKVVKADGSEWSSGDEYKTITECCKFNGVSRYELSDNDLYWFDYEIELYEEPQTEFMFQEVIARIKPGEVWESRYRVVSLNGHILSISYKNISKIESRDLRINLENKFKLQEPKKHTWIYKVEHQKNGKHYDFISSQLLQDDEFVVCDTCKGESYGRVAEIISKELTESEIKQYKECWRA